MNNKSKLLKRSVGILVLLVLSVILLFGLGKYFDYAETILPTPSIMESHAFLLPFHAGSLAIQPLAFNFDSETLEYQYKTSFTNAADLFAAIETQISKEGWQRSHMSSNKRMYINNNPDSKYDDLGVTVTFLPEKSFVKISKYRLDEQ